MEEVTGIYSRFFPFLDRFVEIEMREESIVSVTFQNTEDDGANSDHPLLDRIEDYLTGTVEEDFADVDVDLVIDADYQDILANVRSIPYGESAAVGDVARDIEGMDPEDSDALIAIRTALDANPVPLIIPDHRVRDGPSGAPPDVEQRLRAVEQSGG